MDMHIDISVQFYGVTCQIRPLRTIPHTSELLENYYNGFPIIRTSGWYVSF